MAESCAIPHEETLALIQRAQAGDEEAQEQLVIGNAPLVRSIVRKYTGRGSEYEDLYQIGCLGLIKAIRNFNTDYNVRFSTYAVPMIAGEIKRFLRDDGMIKVSRSLKELAARAAVTQMEISSRIGREPGVAEIAEAMGEAPEDIAMALEASRPHMSIFEPAFGEDSEPQVIDRMAGEGDGEEQALNRVMLKELLGTLDARERRIIILRYFSDKTQSQIAAMLGVSQVQVSRLENRILQKLRELAT
ncbi:MAG: SigB/SigF/SigG family RNA polymerase sigma factor [Clostridia bacterium]|nr:SigB/SigF/SigG family RNA polymerase sigma factor [Candidatus Pelethousia sp.]NCB29784.1 SigB/SigF/SigG family RNA polymerase sigma factor [Clostridia bacterium]